MDGLQQCGRCKTTAASGFIPQRHHFCGHAYTCDRRATAGCTGLCATLPWGCGGTKGRSFVRSCHRTKRAPGRGHPDRRAAPPRRLRGRAAAGRGARRHAVTCPGAAVSGMAAMSGVWLRALRAALPVPLGLPAVRRLRTAAPRPAFAKELFLGSLRKVRRARRGPARAPAAPQGTRGPGCGCLYRGARPGGLPARQQRRAGPRCPRGWERGRVPGPPRGGPAVPGTGCRGARRGSGRSRRSWAVPDEPACARTAHGVVGYTCSRTSSVWTGMLQTPCSYEPSGTTSACVGLRALNTCVPRNLCRFILCLPQGTRLYATFC